LTVIPPFILTAAILKSWSMEVKKRGARIKVPEVCGAGFGLSPRFRASYRDVEPIALSRIHLA
jgi:hypothetical protein